MMAQALAPPCSLISDSIEMVDTEDTGLPWLSGESRRKFGFSDTDSSLVKWRPQVLALTSLQSWLGLFPSDHDSDQSYMKCKGS